MKLTQTTFLTRIIFLPKGFFLTLRCIKTCFLPSVVSVNSIKININKRIYCIYIYILLVLCKIQLSYCFSAMTAFKRSLKHFQIFSNRVFFKTFKRTYGVLQSEKYITANLNITYIALKLQNCRLYKFDGSNAEFPKKVLNVYCRYSEKRMKTVDYAKSERRFLQKT